VIAAGAGSVEQLSAKIGKLVSEIYPIGDAKEPRNAMEAIREGFLTGLKV
jgi:hypothetical protein